MKTTVDLEKLEDVKVTFGKDAFKPKVLHCSRDNSKMVRVLKEIPVSENIKVIFEKIDIAAKKSGRRKEDIIIVKATSKDSGLKEIYKLKEKIKNSYVEEISVKVERHYEISE